MSVKAIKAIILNDTSRNKKHLGCLLVMENIFKLCRKYNIEVDASYQNTAVYQSASYIKALKLMGVVIVNGEGPLHHDQSPAMEIMESVKLARKYKKKCYLINSTRQDNIKLNEMLHFFEKIFVRGSLSFRQILAYSSELNVSVVPDLTLYSFEDTVESPTLPGCGAAIMIDNVNWSVTKK